MPQVIPYIVYYGAIALEAGAGWAAVAAIVASVVVSSYMQRQQSQAARDQYNASLKDRFVMTATTDRARSIVYGQVRNVDGILFKATHGVNREFYTLVIAMAGHEVEELGNVFFNDIVVTLDGNGYVQTAPYLRTDRNSYTEAVQVTNGTGSITLQKLPIPGTIYATPIFGAGGKGPGPTPALAVSGSTVTLTIEIDGEYTVTYQSSEGTSYARVRKYLGSPSQDISQTLHDLIPQLAVVGRHRFRGIALLLVTLQYNEDAFPAGVPSITSVIKGKKVWDPRSNTTAYSENPSLCALDWAMDEHGGGLDYGEVIGQSFIDAANASDVSTAFTGTTDPGGVWQQIAIEGEPLPNISPPTVIRFGSGYTWRKKVISGSASWCTTGEFGPLDADGSQRVCQIYHSEYTTGISDVRYRCGTVAVTDTSADKVFSDLVQSMAGAYGWSGGKLRLRAGAWRIPLITHITEDWVSDQGAIGIQPGTALQDTYNAVTASISDAEQDYVALPLPEVVADAYVAQDGIKLPTTMQMNAVTHAWHAQDIVEVLMLEGRQALSMQLPCKMHAYMLDLFDVVPVDLSAYGFNGKYFEVRGWSFTITGGVMLLLRETAPESYDPATLFTFNDLADNTELPKPWIVEDVVGLTAETVVALDNDQQLVSRTQITWSPMTSAAVLANGKVEVQWASLGFAPNNAQWVNGAGDDMVWANTYGELLEWVATQALLLSDSDWNSRREPGTSTSTLVVGLRAGYVYLVRARAVTQVASGMWCEQIILIIPTIATSDIAAIALAQAAAAAAAAAAQQAAASAANAITAVAAAVTAANNAAAAASAAVLQITGFTDDNVLSPVEKMGLIIDYETILAEQPGIDAEAIAYGIVGVTADEKNLYDGSIVALSSYLATVPTWDDTTLATTIDGPSLRAAFIAVYTARQALLNKIAQIAGTRAAWANITNIPYDSIYSNDDSVALGFNPTFSAWTGIYPDGWTNWSGAAPTKETTLVRVGLYSVRYAANASNQGIYAQAAWTTTPMALGTFIAGSIDIYLLNRVSGLPGVLVELYTDAALTTKVQTLVQPPSAGVGSWQRVSFSARVGDMERIYGIRVYLIASWTAFTSGAYTGTVIFDNLRLAFFDQSIDNTSITIGDDGTLSGAGGGQVTISGLGFTGDLDATYGADATNFFGHIGGGNLLRKSAFREDINQNGLADSWQVWTGPGVVTPSIAEGGGMFGGNAQVITWAFPNTDAKGLFTAGVVGGWEPNQTYVLSFYARASGSNIGHGCDLGWSTVPITNAIGRTDLLNPPLTSAFQRYAFRLHMPVSPVEPNGQIWISVAYAAGTQGGISFSAVQVTKGDVLTEYMEAIEDIRLQALAAQATATQAAADAAAALSGIGIAVSDNVLAPTEKKAIIQDVTVLLNEQGGIDGAANSHGITTQKATYDATMTSLTNYLATLVSPVAWNVLTGPTNINGATFKQRFIDIYAARQSLLNAIAAADLTAAQSALTNSAAAVSNANAAIAFASAANDAITNMSSDNVLTPVEKAAFITDWYIVVNEKAGIDAQAAALGTTVEKQAYDDAYNTFINYLATLNNPTLWYDLNGNTTINGATFRGNFVTLLNAKQVVLNRIVAIASTMAQWGGVSNVAITTPQIVPNAVTVPQYAINTSGTVVISVGSFTGGGVAVPLVSLSWFNNTADTVLLQIEATGSIDVTATGTSFGYADMWTYVSTGGVFPAGVTQQLRVFFTQQYADANSFPPLPKTHDSGSQIRQLNVAPGTSITVGLYMGAANFRNANTGNITATWENASLRITALKR